MSTLAYPFTIATRLRQETANTDSTMFSARRIQALLLVVLLHIALLYALQSGLMMRIAEQIVPKEIMATLVAPPAPKIIEAPPTPEKKVEPKEKPLIKPTPKQTFVPDRPKVVNNTPSETAITVPMSKEEPSPAPSPAAAPVVAAAPPAPPTPPAPKIISGVEYIRAPAPIYPPLSRRMNEEGKVVLRVIVNEHGHAEKASIITSSGSARLDEAARDAVLKAQYKPYIEDGHGIPVSVVVPISFSLDG